MAEYIDREAALEIIKRTSGDYAAAFSEVARHPVADVAEVKHGKWIPQVEYNFEKHEDDLAGYCCSECDLFYIVEHNFCPNCGAKMKG